MCDSHFEERTIRFQLSSDLASGNGWPTSGHANSLQLTAYFHLIAHEHKPDASDEVLQALAVISDSLAACLLAAILGAKLRAARFGMLTSEALSWSRFLAVILCTHSFFSF